MQSEMLPEHNFVETYTGDPGTTVSLTSPAHTREETPKESGGSWW